MEKNPPPFLATTPKNLKGARRLGVKYEGFVQAQLLDQYEEKYIPSPWLKYREINDEKFHWAQPDGLLIDLRSGLIIIVEIKLRHTSDAWWQTQMKYLPLLKKLFGDDFSFGIMEVVKWYDPAVAFPVNYRMLPQIHYLRANEFGVHIRNQ